MSKLQSIVSRSRGKANKGKKKKDGAPFQHGTQQFGPFSVFYSAHNRKIMVPDPEKPGKEKWNGEWEPTGEISMKVEIGNSYPKTSIGWNHEGSGPLSTIAENLDAFVEAVAAAVSLWGDDNAFQSAMLALDAHIASSNGQTAEPQTASSNGGLVNRVKNRAAG